MGRRFTPTVMDETVYDYDTGERKYIVPDDTLAKIANTHVSAKYSRKNDSAVAIKKWMEDHGLKFLKSAKLADLTLLRADYIKKASLELIERPKRNAREDIEGRMPKMAKDIQKVLNSLERNTLSWLVVDRYHSAVFERENAKEEMLNYLRAAAEVFATSAANHKKGSPSYDEDLFKTYNVDLPTMYAKFPGKLALLKGKWLAADRNYDSTRRWFWTVISNSDEVWQTLDYFLPEGREYSFHQFDIMVNDPDDKDAPMWEAFVNDHLVARSALESEGEPADKLVAVKEGRVSDSALKKLNQKAHEMAAAMGLIDSTLSDLSAALEADLDMLPSDDSESNAPKEIAPLEQMDF